MNQDDIEVIFSHDAESGATGELGVDAKGHLYWNDKLLITKQEITLERSVNGAIIAGAISTVVIAAVAVLDYLC